MNLFNKITRKETEIRVFSQLSFKFKNKTRNRIGNSVIITVKLFVINLTKL